jgi:hypothetical protein
VVAVPLPAEVRLPLLSYAYDVVLKPFPIWVAAWGLA